MKAGQANAKKAAKGITNPASPNIPQMEPTTANTVGAINARTNDL